MRKRSLVLGVLLVVVGVFGFGSSAFAAATATLSPASPFSTPSVSVTVTYSGMTPNQPVFLAECNNDQGPNFDANADCSPFTTTQFNGNATGSGVQTVILQEVPDDAGDIGWDCNHTLGTPTGVVSGGIKHYSVCQFRINDSSVASTANVQIQPIQWGAPSTDVPEAPLAILLPLGGLALIGGAYLILRGRHTLTI